MKATRLFPAILLTALASAALADDGWIKRTAEVRSDPSAAADSLIAVHKGDKIQVLEESDGWTKISIKGKTGWVATDSVSSRQVKPDTSLSGRDSAADMSSGAAIKGLQPIAGDYARGRNLSQAGLDEMVAIKKSVTPQMLKDFTTEGNIEPVKKSKK